MENRKTSWFVLAAIAAVGTLALASCQLVELGINGTTYYDTEITTKDNRLITGRIGGQRSANLSAFAKTISIRTDEGRQKIKSEQIMYMKLARKGHPEKQQTLVYADFKLLYKKKGEQRAKTYKSWQVIENVGDYLLVTAYGNSYSLSKDGSLIITYDRDEGIKYCIKRPGDDCPVYLGRSTQGRSSMRSKWQEYLADDPALCEKIKSKKIDAFDFKEIVEQYNPGK